MKLKILLTYSLLGALLLSFSGLFAQGISDTREMNRTYKLRQGSEVQIDSRYGEITIHSWDKNELRIEAELKVRGKDRDDVDLVIEQMDVVVEGDENGLSISTEFGDSRNVSGNNGGMSIEYKNGKKAKGIKERSINMDIYLPRDIDLELEHRFGTAYLDDHRGDLSVEIKHGTFMAESLQGRSSLDIAHSTAKIGSLSRANLDVKHSTLDLGEGGTLNIDCSYSTFSLGDADSINLDQKHSTTNIASVSRITFDDKYSDFRIGEVTDVIVGESDYGNCSVGYVSRNFSKVILSGRHGNISVKMDEQASYSLDAEGEHSSLQFPSGLKATEDISKPTYRKIRGTVGGGGGKVVMEMQHGSLKIK